MLDGKKGTAQTILYNAFKKVEEKTQKIDLTILTVGELRELAKKKEVKGYSKMKKEELIEALK